MITRKSKYQLVGQQLRDESGVLVDIGARDRVLHGYLPPHLDYRSADVIEGHDYIFNLEKPLVVEDQAFDYVTALDVLEHLENIHDAFNELIRITRKKLFVSLPNMTCLSFRLHFFRHGQLSGKYDLLPEHQGDRHRWVTDFHQSSAFIHHHAAPYQVRQYNIVSGYGLIQNICSRLPLSPALRTYTQLFEISKS